MREDLKLEMKKVEFATIYFFSKLTRYSISFVVYIIRSKFALEINVTVILLLIKINVIRMTLRDRI